jgi:hypothetical protein
MPETPLDRWVRWIIHGPGGMVAAEEREMIKWAGDDRTAVANWVLRCLSNPDCEGSADALSDILERRAELLRHPSRAGRPAETLRPLSRWPDDA